MSLARAILESHGTEDGGLRLDHAVVGAESAELTLAALEASRVARVTCDVALLDGDRRSLSAGFEESDVVAALQERARARGFHFVRPGAGSVARVHFERFAAPGRLIAAAGVRAHLAGAAGSLAIGCDAIELAAALAGEPLVIDPPEVRIWELRGRLPAHVSGADLALEVARRLDAPEPGAWRVVEFAGEGLGGIALVERARAVAALDRLGAAAALFGSDEATRAGLKELGREADWRAHPAALPDTHESLDLESLEPMLAALEGALRPRPAADLAGASVSRVVLGPWCALEDVAAFLAALGGRRIAATVRALWIPGSLAQLTRATERGWLEALAAAGAEVSEVGAAPPGALADSGLTLATGIPDAAEFGAPLSGWHLASPGTLAASALDASVADPRQRATLAELPVLPIRVSDGWVLPPAPAAAEGAAPARSAPWIAGRREVLLALEDDVAVDDVLPWGARLDPFAGDIEALSDHVFGRGATDFAARARARRGGIVIAGARFGRPGRAPEQAALALAALGIHIVIAHSFEPAFERRLVCAGVLPLTALPGAGVPHAGEELELPGVPERLMPGRPVPVRNLTRGIETLAWHALGARELDLIRRGGLLPRAGAFARAVA